MAFAVGAMLLPMLARGTRWHRPAQIACWGTGGIVAVAFVSYVTFPAAFCGPKDRSSCWIYADTIRSIPAAFDPNRTDYGKGQGTRRYLLVGESARHLQPRTDTGAVLRRSSHLRRERRCPACAQSGFRRTRSAQRDLSGVRPRLAVGLGVVLRHRYRDIPVCVHESQSLRLEALDQMTNHDNPHNNYLYVLASVGITGLAGLSLAAVVSAVAGRTRRFIARPRPLLSVVDGEYEANLIASWTFEEANGDRTVSFVWKPITPTRSSICFATKNQAGRCSEKKTTSS